MKAIRIHTRPGLLLIAIIVLLGAIQGWARIPDLSLAFGTPFRVDENPMTSVESPPAAAVGSDGHFVIVWPEGANLIQGRFYDNQANPSGNIFTAAITELFWDAALDVGMADDGSIVVSYIAYFSHVELYAQRLGAAGLPLGLPINVTDQGNIHPYEQALAVADDGSFVLVWTAVDTDHSDDRLIQGRFYGSNGVPAGLPFRVNTTDDVWLGNPDVDMSPDGRSVVVWASNHISGNIYAQRYDANGFTDGSEILVPSNAAGDELFPSVAMDADGDFVVIWIEDALRMIGRAFDADGLPLGNDYLVSEDVSSAKADLTTIDMAANGDHVVGWQEQGDSGVTWGAMARFFRGIDHVAGPEFQANQTLTMDQFPGRFGVGPNGQTVVVWMSEETPLEDWFDIFARYYECFTDERCDDGLYCNGMESCSSGECVPGVPPNCFNDGQWCNGLEFCDEQLDECSHRLIPDCSDDGLWCNGEEFCDEANNACGHQNAPECADDGNFCNGAESCDEASDSCVSAGNPCPDDGLFCNGGEACDETGDQCVHLDAPNCTDDGLFCNGNEICDETNDRCASTGDPCDGGQTCVEETQECAGGADDDADDDDDDDTAGDDAADDAASNDGGKGSGGGCGC